MKEGERKRREGELGNPKLKLKYEMTSVRKAGAFRHFTAMLYRGRHQIVQLTLPFTDPITYLSQLSHRIMLIFFHFRIE